MIYFLVPVFNEAPNLEELFSNLEGCLPGEEKFFVFSDDGSSDGSVQKLEKLFEKKSFIVLGDGKNHGPGYAFNLGFDWILNHSSGTADSIVTLEADNTSDISILDKMMTCHKMGFDLVLSSVYAQGGGFEKTSFFRRFLSAVANLGLRFIFDIRVQTLSSFYRVYSVELLRKVKKEYGIIIREPGFLCMIELLLKIVRQKGSVIEVPMMLFSSKRKGKSKMKVLKTSWSYFRFMINPKL